MLKKVFFKSAVLLAVIMLILGMAVYADDTATNNLVKNPGFEKILNEFPSNWDKKAYLTSSDAVEYTVSQDSHSGKHSITIYNKKPNVAAVVQEIPVKPGQIYKVSAWVKTEGVKNSRGAASIWLVYGDMANGIYTSPEVKDTGSEWKLLEFNIKMLKGYDKVTLYLSLGGVGTNNEGRASFDDVSVEIVKKADPAITQGVFYVPPKEGGKKQNKTKSTETRKVNTANKTSGIKTPFVIVGVVLFVILIIFLEVKFSDKNEKQSDKKTESADNSDNDKKIVEDEYSDEEINAMEEED